MARSEQWIRPLTRDGHNEFGSPRFLPIGRLCFLSLIKGTLGLRPNITMSSSPKKSTMDITIVRNILRHLDPTGQKDSQVIRNAALVHSSWTPACQSLLFQTVEFKDCTDFPRFAALLAQRPDLGKHVRALSLVGHWPTHSCQAATSLITIIEACRSICWLTLVHHNFNLEAMHERLAYLVDNLSAVRTLALRSCKGVNLATLGSHIEGWNHLRRLEFAWTSFQQAALIPKTLPKIRELVIDHPICAIADATKPDESVGMALGHMVSGVHRVKLRVLSIPEVLIAREMFCNMQELRVVDMDLGSFEWKGCLPQKRVVEEGGGISESFLVSTICYTAAHKRISLSRRSDHYLQRLSDNLEGNPCHRNVISRSV